MKASKKQFGQARNRSGLVVVVVLAVSMLAGSVGCDDLAGLAGLTGMTGLGTEIPYGNPALKNVPSWGGLADPNNTSSLGLPQFPGTYWGNVMAGM